MVHSLMLVGASAKVDAMKRFVLAEPMQISLVDSAVRLHDPRNIEWNGSLAPARQRGTQLCQLHIGCNPENGIAPTEGLWIP